MNCFCDEETTILKIEGDVGADSFWCNLCNSNLEIGEIPISNELKSSLVNWTSSYAEWMDWGKDEFLPAGRELEKNHNRTGEKLTKLVQEELEGKYIVTFSESKMWITYRDIERK